MRILVLLLLGIALAPAFAADIEFRSTEVSAPTQAPLNPEAERKLVAELVHMIHESIENEDPNAKGISGLVKNWVHNLNFLEIGRNVYRYAHSEGKKGPLNHLVPDILTMLAVSHTIETTSALWGIPLARSLGAPAGVQWMLGVVGGVISVPGLDPLCIGLMFTYSVSPRFRKVVSVGRIAAFKSAHFLGQVSGVNALVRQVFERQDRMEHLLEYLDRRGTKEHSIDFEPGEKTRLSFRDRAGRKLVTLEFSPGENGRWNLETMTWDRKADLRRVLKEPAFRKMGWNVRSMVRQVVQWDRKGRVDDLRERFYVDSLLTEEARGSVRFQEGAVDMPTKLRFKRRKPTSVSTACKHSFGALGS